MNTFRYTAYAQEIVFGVGALTKLGDASAAYGWKHIILCTSPSLRRNGTINTIETTLKDRLAATYERVSAHVQEHQLNEALQLAEQHNVDAVIGLGGGSPIGMAKAVSMHLEARRTGVAEARVSYPTDQPLVPNIAIPTTYAGSEMTPMYGVTRAMDDGSTRKLTVRDGKVAPKLVIYDPALTLDLPPSVTAATGINGLAHCIEAIYSTTRHPLSTAAALSGIRHITASLLRCYQHGGDLEARTEMLLGAHLGGACLATVTMGVHHGTCHVLGGTAGVAHGVANSIILPHAIRFNLDTVAPLIAQAGEAMGIQRSTESGIPVQESPASLPLSVYGEGVGGRGSRSDAEIGEQVAQYVYDLVGKMNLPQRLRDADVPEDLLPKLAENMLKSKAVNENPKPVTSVDQAMSLLRAAW